MTKNNEFARSALLCRAKRYLMLYFASIGENAADASNTLKRFRFVR